MRWRGAGPTAFGGFIGMALIVSDRASSGEPSLFGSGSFELGIGR
jgi:hypothetical protein